MSESPRAMTDAQFRALLQACRDRRHRNSRRDRVLFTFLGGTGLRVSEALAVTAGDLLLNDDPPCVRVRTLKRRRPQGEAPPELVDLGPSTARVLGEWIRWIKAPGVYGPRPGPQWLFVGGRAGAPLSRFQVNKLFRRYARRAGLPDRLTLHSLRHYRATQILQHTGDVEYARMQLRHRSLETTQRYLHHTLEQRRHYLDLIDGVTPQRR